MVDKTLSPTTSLFLIKVEIMNKAIVIRELSNNLLHVLHVFIFSEVLKNLNSTEYGILVSVSYTEYLLHSFLVYVSC